MATANQSLYPIQALLGQLKNLIDPALLGLQDADTALKEVQESVAKKAEAETAYKQAHGERAQIIEAIENLKKQHEGLMASQAAETQARIGDASAGILAAKHAAEKRISEIKAEVAKAASDAAQRIGKAEAAADEAEARVKKAEAALEALKRA